MRSTIEELRDVWEAHAKYDPLWAILSDASKKGRKWDLKLFFETGHREISSLMSRLSELNLCFNPGMALDFGCGVGRLTQSLSVYFEKAIGVDISKTMIDLAKRLNNCGDSCQFIANEKENLDLLESDSFDLIYASIVLQHIPPEIMSKYLSEFLRILRTNGILVFQLPSHERKEYLLGHTPEPFHENAYRAKIIVDSLPLSSAPPSTDIQIKVKVINNSAFDWRQTEMALIRLGNHWLEADSKRIIVRDDGRSKLPCDLKAGEETEVILTIKTPEKEGKYLCELDLVHESIAWFKDKDSATEIIEVEVTSKTPWLSPHKSKFPTKSSIDEAEDIKESDIDSVLPKMGEEPKPFSMYVTKKEKIINFFHERNAEVVSVDEDGRCGWEWHSYCYYIRKAEK
jgi:SAM-dependent methyltransferase